jgi:hypothetical protein
MRSLAAMPALPCKRPTPGIGKHHAEQPKTDPFGYAGKRPGSGRIVKIRELLFVLKCQEGVNIFSKMPLFTVLGSLDHARAQGIPKNISVSLVGPGLDANTNSK